MRMRGRRGGGGRRPLAHGDLRLLILSLIDEAPRHGYDLISEIERRTAGVYKPSPGVMYPALEVIQDLGWAEASRQDGKKIFEIIEDGKAVLEDEADAIDKINERLDALAGLAEPEDPADVRAAMRALRHTVIRRVAAAWPDDELNTKIAKILSEARRNIADLD